MDQQTDTDADQMRKYRRQAALAEADAAQARAILANLLTDWDGDDELIGLREKIADKLRWAQPDKHVAPELINSQVMVTLDGDWMFLCQVTAGNGPADTRWLATYLRSEETNKHVYEVKQTR